MKNFKSIVNWFCLKSNLLLAILTITCHADLRAELLLGLHVSGDKLAYAYQKKIVLKSVSTDTVISECEPVKDSGISSALYRKAVKLHRIGSGEANEQLKNSILDFSIVNLTFYQKKLFVGIRYYIGKFKKSKICYGIIVLDENLQLSNYYLFQLAPSQAFSVPPYFPMEFADNKHLVMPDLDSGKVIIGKFFLNDSLHEVRRIAVLKKNVQLSVYNQVKFPENLLLDPVLFSVSGSAYRFYFQFPKPVIFANSKSKLFDPGGHEKSVRNYRAPHLGDGTHLLFERQFRRDSAVVLATCTQNDSIFILSSSLLPGFVELYRCESPTGIFSPRWIRTEMSNRYFLLDGRRLIILYIKDGKTEIEVKTY